ncbi:MAG: YceI family protein, partial [Chitinophagaceae bacterium]
VKGRLTLHNVTKELEVPGTIKVENGKLEALSTFAIQLSDYKITIPSAVKNKVANAITITVDTKLELLKN